MLLYIRQRGLCALCGGMMHIHQDDIERDLEFMATVDHIKRLRDGGSSELANLRAVHKRCNQLRN